MDNNNGAIVPVSNSNIWSISVNPQQLQQYGQAVVRSAQNVIKDKDKCKSIAIGTVAGLGAWVFNSFAWPLIGIGIAGHTAYKVSHNHIVRNKPEGDLEQGTSVPKSLWDGTIVQKIFGWGKNEPNTNQMQNPLITEIPNEYTPSQPTAGFNQGSSLLQLKDGNQGGFSFEGVHTEQSSQFVEVPLRENNDQRAGNNLHFVDVQDDAPRTQFVPRQARPSNQNLHPQPQQYQANSSSQPMPFGGYPPVSLNAPQQQPQFNQNSFQQQQPPQMNFSSQGYPPVTPKPTYYPQPQFNQHPNQQQQSNQFNFQCDN